MIPPSLRKAAVLISTLDERAAEAILRALEPEESAKVRRALVELNEIPASEQQQVLAEFLSQQGAPALAASTAGGGVELDVDFSAESAPSVVAETSEEQATPTKQESLFGFLENVEPSAIAAVLAREHIQTIAAIVSRLSPSQAAAVLESLPPQTATDALERMASLLELTQEVQQDLVDELRRQLASQLYAAAAGPASLARLSAVLDAMGYDQRQRVVKNLAQQNAALLRRAGVVTHGDHSSTFEPSTVVSFRYRLESAPNSQPTRTPPRQRISGASWLDFEDLAQLDDAALKTVFAACEPEVALIALTGAAPAFVNRILGHLSSQQATVLRQRLDHPGPIRLRDIEQARQELAAAAGQLAREGEIVLPPRVRFAAAV